MAVMDRQVYIAKVQGLLDKDNYRSLSKDPTPKLKSQIVNILKLQRSRTG